jgi:Protein of unknown function (DUF3551)
MKSILFAAGLLMVVNAAPAQAQNYPWCAYYSGSPDGPTNCGFSTFQQCLATISGIGGFCDRNNMYQPPPGPHPQQQARHKSHTQS